MEVAVEAEAPLAVGDFFAQLLQARREGALSGDAAEQAFSAGAVKILELKGAHRQLCEATDALREAAGEAKSQLDQSSLQLQNLLYERQHYEKEISSCRGWRSAYSDEQIALIPVEEFSTHPLAVEGKLAEASDPHQLMLNRLRHEVAFRQEFVKQLEKTKAARDALASDVAQKRSSVAGLEAEIGKLLAAARVVQQQYAIKPLDSAAAAAAGDGGGALDGVEQQAAEEAPPPPPPQQQQGGAGAAAMQEG